MALKYLWLGNSKIFSYRAAALCTTTVLQTTVHCRLVVRKHWGIGGYSLSYGLHNCIDCIGSSFLGHYLVLSNDRFYASASIHHYCRFIDKP